MFIFSVPMVSQNLGWQIVMSRSVKMESRRFQGGMQGRIAGSGDKRKHMAMLRFSFSVGSCRKFLHKTFFHHSTSTIIDDRPKAEVKNLFVVLLKTSIPIHPASHKCLIGKGKCAGSEEFPSRPATIPIRHCQARSYLPAVIKHYISMPARCRLPKQRLQNRSQQFPVRWIRYPCRGHTPCQPRSMQLASTGRHWT